MLRWRLCLKRFATKQHIFFRRNKFARRTNLCLFFYKHPWKIAYAQSRSLRYSYADRIWIESVVQCAITAKNNIYTLVSHIFGDRLRKHQESTFPFIILSRSNVHSYIASNAKMCPVKLTKYIFYIAERGREGKTHTTFFWK